MYAEHLNDLSPLALGHKDKLRLFNFPSVIVNDLSACASAHKEFISVRGSRASTYKHTSIISPVNYLCIWERWFIYEVLSLPSPIIKDPGDWVCCSRFFCCCTKPWWNSWIVYAVPFKSIANSEALFFFQTENIWVWLPKKKMGDKKKISFYFQVLTYGSGTQPIAPLVWTRPFSSGAKLLEHVTGKGGCSFPSTILFSI